MAYNIRIYHYASGRQIRHYGRVVQDGFSRGQPPDNKDLTDDPADLARAPTYLWPGDFKDGWEHFEPDPVERQKRSVASSLNRTKQAIYGIARANCWDYFLTLTFDRSITDSSDYDLVVKRVGKWLNNIRQRYCSDLYYLIVPELHADREHWHLHGLLGGCDGLRLTDSGHKDAQGRTIYNLENWKYGFSTVTEIGDMSRVSSYITKYITKDLCEVTKDKRRYLASRNCLSAKDVCEKILVLDGNGVGTLLEDMSERIVYTKCQTVKAAHQVVNYYELSD